MKSFLIDCNLSQNEDYGLSVFLSNRKQNLTNDIKYNNIKFHHVLMENYARHGDFETLFRIYTILVEDKITPNFQTFALIFECIGRMPVNEKTTELLEKFARDAERNVVSRT